MPSIDSSRHPRGPVGQPDAGARPLRLLIVEDVAADAELAVAVLRRAGYAVTFDLVGSPAALHQKLREGRCDLILADYNLGQWTGLDALAIVKGCGRDVPLILCTAELGDEAAVECIKDGATDYVLKEHLDRLPFAVERALREKSQREEAARLQQVILRGKQEWEATFDNIPDPVILFDDCSRVKRANRAAAAALERPIAELIGMSWSETLHGLDQSVDPGPQRAVLQSGLPTRMVMDLPRLEKVLESCLSPVLNGAGVPVGSIFVIRDITERKRAEEALREKEKLFRTLFEEAPIPYHEIDAEGIVRGVNRAECSLLGCAAQQIIGKPVWEFVAPEERNTSREAVRRRLAGQEPLAPFGRTYLRPDGTRLIVEIHENLIRDAHNAIVGMRSALLNITERVRAEEARHDSEGRQRNLFENAIHGIYRADSDGRLLDVNPALVAMLGYDSAGELKTKSLTADIYCRPEDRARLVEMFPLGPQGQEVEWKRKDGRPIVVRLNGRVVRDRTGRTECFEMFAENVSERRNLEEQLRQAVKMEAVGRLAGGVAHDFNNILTVISGYSDLLMELLPPGDQVRHATEEIQKAAERAASLTRQLLAFSRKQVLDPKVLNLNNVIRNIEKLLRRLIGEDLELSISLASDLWQVRADPSQLEQVIMNLAVNARDAMPQGGNLIIETRNVLFEDSAAHGFALAPGPYVLLAVSDAGCGMDQETLRHIFEPFFTTKDPSKGTGLGLATVLGIVQQSGGQVWAYSEPGMGSTFNVYLPRTDACERPAQTAPLNGEASAGSETILLVEDERGVREFVLEILKRKGYTALAAADAEEALSLSEKYPGAIDLLLTDTVMPRMNGRELAERLVQLRPDIKVLYMSGYTEDAVVQRGVLRATVAFVQKPFTTGILMSRIRDVLEGRAPGTAV